MGPRLRAEWGYLSDVMGLVWNFLCVGTNQHVRRSPSCGLSIRVTTCDTFEWLRVCFYITCVFVSRWGEQRTAALVYPKTLFNTKNNPLG